MIKRPIRFAFAVNEDRQFESCYFGKADKYLIYEWNHKDLVFIREQINGFRNYEEEHGFQQKGHAVINLLRNLDVNVLVSSNFGRNIQAVNAHFIPVSVSAEAVSDVISLMKKHMKWIEDEWMNSPERFKFFSIRKGIMKLVIKPEY